MRRKTIIVLGITFMVTVMVTAFSYLYISQILRQRITNAYESASRLTQQLAYFAGNDLPDLSSTRIDTNDPAAVRRALAEYLPMDTNILNNLESEVALWPFIYDASIVDANGRALLHTNRQLVGKQIIVVANLEPRAMRGEISQGMLLAATDSATTKVIVLTPSEPAGAGSKVS